MSGDTALVIIDVQMGMFDQDDPVHNGEQLLQILSDLIGSMSLDAFDGRIEPFDELVHLVRPHQTGKCTGCIRST